MISACASETVECFTHTVSLVSVEEPTWEEAQRRMFSFFLASPCCELIKCWKPLFGRQMNFFLVQLEETGCLLLPNLLEYEFSSPLFLSFVLIVCNFIEASCAASEKVSRKKNIYYPGWGQKWRFVNNKNAIFVFQIKHIDFFPMSKFTGLIYDELSSMN